MDNTSTRRPRRPHTESRASFHTFDTDAAEASRETSADRADIPRRSSAERGQGASRGARRSVRRGRVTRFPDRAALALLCVGLLIGGIVTFGIMKAQEGRKISQAVQEKMQGIRDSLSEGKSVLSTLRKAYTDDLVMYKDGKYVFMPIDSGLKKHSFVSDNVTVLPSGEWQYAEGDKVISHKGIDVSSHQGVIDWAKVAADGVEHAFIRAMYRGYGSGKLVEDTSFKANVDGALSNGIKTGVYVFTQAVTRQEVEEEVEMLKGLLEPYTLEGPVVVDVEQTAEGTGRMDALDAATRTELVKYFCELVEQAGYHPMIYCNIETALLMLNFGELENYDKWFATYNKDFYFPYRYTVWQYTDKGHVDGIEGNVDLDLIF